ncbi:hypothetical protein CFIMG_008660RA00001 [Ceratocystis fimbriata CBS 114723]|uniref:Uncharacterized protein n=1 Tax=Ceratocystis fimbriata CBS 114723 TaxID=1035309 RepID=A0A2C5X0Z6_9PEZI|nr:hypothetical protein CFIMG_008660RA00001 [Ceratocystis fimbriata CBS 114723]
MKAWVTVFILPFASTALASIHDGMAPANTRVEYTNCAWSNGKCWCTDPYGERVMKGLLDDGGEVCLDSDTTQGLEA